MELKKKQKIWRIPIAGLKAPIKELLIDTKLNKSGMNGKKWNLKHTAHSVEKTKIGKDQGRTLLVPPREAQGA